MKHTYIEYSYVTYRDMYCMYKYVVYLGDLNKLTHYILEILIGKRY